MNNVFIPPSGQPSDHDGEVHAMRDDKTTVCGRGALTFGAERTTDEVTCHMCTKGGE